VAKDDIEKMVKDAEAHAEEDKKRRETVETKNQAEALIHATEKTLKEAGDKVPAPQRQAVETAIAELKAVSGGDDLGQIRSKTEALGQASMQLGEALYKAQAPQGGAPGPGPEGPQGPGGGQGPQGPGAGSDKVVDADFEEVDEKKRGQA